MRDFESSVFHSFMRPSYCDKIRALIEIGEPGSAIDATIVGQFCCSAKRLESLNPSDTDQQFLDHVQKIAFLALIDPQECMARCLSQFSRCSWLTNSRLCRTLMALG